MRTVCACFCAWPRRRTSRRKQWQRSVPSLPTKLRSTTIRPRTARRSGCAAHCIAATPSTFPLRAPAAPSAPSRRSCCGAVLTRFMFRPIWRLSSWAMWTRRLPHGLHRSVCRRTSRRRLHGLAAKRNLRAHSGTERAGNSRSASRCFLLAFGQSRPQSRSGRNSRDSLPPNCCWAKVQRYMKAFIHAA